MGWSEGKSSIVMPRFRPVGFALCAENSRARNGGVVNADLSYCHASA